MYNSSIQIWLCTYMSPFPEEYDFSQVSSIIRAQHRLPSRHNRLPIIQNSRTQSTLDTIFWCYQAWHRDQCTPELQLPRRMLLVCLQNNGNNPSASAKVFGRAMWCCTKRWLEMQFMQNRSTFGNNMAIVCSIFVPTWNNRPSVARRVRWDCPFLRFLDALFARAWAFIRTGLVQDISMSNEVKSTNIRDVGLSENVLQPDRYCERVSSALYVHSFNSHRLDSHPFQAKRDYMSACGHKSSSWTSTGWTNQRLTRKQVFQPANVAKVTWSTPSFHPLSPSLISSLLLIIRLS